MERQKPRPQELYRHFKGNLYQIVTTAIHSETREEMVIYQALYGDYLVYCRPLDMFMSEVDRNKYPEAVQKYRFEKIELASKDKETDNRVKPVRDLKAAEEVRKQFRNEPYKPSKVMEKTVDDEAQELNLDPLVIEFMDADLASEKNDILSKLRPTITNDMIDIMALSLGVVVNEGDVYDRYNDLRTCLTTMEKFESTRLRS